MKKIIVIIGALIILVMIWISFPTEIVANTYVGKKLSIEDYKLVTKEISLLAKKNNKNGITYGGDLNSDAPVMLYCHGVPLVSISQFRTVTTLQVFNDAGHRAPFLIESFKYLVKKINPNTELNFDYDHKKANRLNKFMLKYRDGIDLDRICNNPTQQTKLKN